MTGERRHRAHEETGLGASGDACDHYDSGHGLEVWHPDERRARRHGKGREHGHHGDLARRRATPFKGNEEGHDGVQNDERAGEVVAVARNAHAHDYGQRGEHQRRENRQQRFGAGAATRARGLSGARGSSFTVMRRSRGAMTRVFDQLWHSSTTSSTVTAFSKSPRLIRLAAVV